MSTPTRSPRTSLRMSLPPSMGADTRARADVLQKYLAQALGREVEISVPSTYETLAKDLLSGKADAAWAPPFVCARIEAMGVRVLVRGVRGGASTYRAALVARKDASVTLDTLEGCSAAWSDRDSVGGYLLPMSFLRDRGLDAGKVFFRQEFLGSYRDALEAVAKGTFDVTSVFAPTSKGQAGERTNVDDVWPGHAEDFKTLAFTEDSPNDGVAVSINAPTPLVADLEKVLLGLPNAPEGQAILKDIFHAERFEVAPRMGYRALYRVALASL